MKRFVKTVVLLGLGFGTAAGVAALVGLPERSHPSLQVGLHVGEPTKSGVSHDLTAFQAEVDRVKSELQNDLTALRSQLARVGRDQEVTGQQLNQITERLGRTAATDTTPSDTEAAAPLTLEQERERAEARAQAELALMEGTLQAEQPDPAWATTAQLVLTETFQTKAIPDALLLDAHCRTTLCRLEMTLEGSTSQDRYRDLLDLAPWSGESLIQINSDTGAVVMYLAREDRALPQVTD